MGVRQAPRQEQLSFIVDGKQHLFRFRPTDFNFGLFCFFHNGDQTFRTLNGCSHLLIVSTSCLLFSFLFVFIENTVCGIIPNITFEEAK